MKHCAGLLLLSVMLLSRTDGQHVSAQESLQVVYTDPLEENLYIFDKKGIERLLLENDDVKDRLIVSVSIAGAMRTGKSFILGFFLRYLNAQYKKHDITNWLENSEDTKGSSFKWKNGIDVRHTQGIHLWSEIFLHNADDGKKYAILIFDTQGIFDQFSTMKDNNVIFATTAYISTVQIFNVMRNIGEDDYQHLQQFAAFGAAAVADSDFKPFQKLLFLIRDSPSVDRYMEFEGGKRLLEARAKSNKEGNSTLDKVNAAFDSVECFLMSAPGYEVSEEPDFNGSLSVIRSKFKDQLNTLIPHILGPNNLKPKKINGDVVTARSFIDYLNLYIEFFKSSDSPNPQNFMEANANANNAKAVSDGYKMYEEISVNSSQNISTLSELKGRHEDFLRQVLSYFDQRTKYGGRFLSAPFRSDLQNKTNAHYTSIRIEFERAIIDKASTSSYIIYKDLTLNIQDGINTLSDFDDKERGFREQAMHFFDERTHDGDLKLSARYRNMLAEQIDALYNSLRIEFERSTIKKALSSSYIIYKDLTFNIQVSTFSDFDDKERGFRKQAMAAFDETTKGVNLKLSARYINKLADQIDALYNSERIKFERAIIDKAYTSSYIIYEDLTLNIQDGINTLSDFDDKERGFREQAMHFFDERTHDGDLELSAWYRNILAEQIDALYNSLRIEFERSTIEKASSSSYIIYKDSTFSIQVSAFSNFDDKERGFRKQAMAAFDETTKGVNLKLSARYRNKLAEQIDALYNSERIKFERAIFDKAYRSSYIIYKDLTLNIQDGINTLSDFDDKERGFREQAMHFFDERTHDGDLELSAWYRNILAEHIDALYNSLRIEFERSTIEKASSSSYIIYKDLTLSIQDGINTFRDFIEKEKGFREQAMAAFDGKTKGVDLKLSTRYRNKLAEQIDALYNSLRIEFERSTIEKASSSSYIIYKDLTLSIQDGINTFRDFIEKEKGFREQAMAAFDGKTKGVDLKLSTRYRNKLAEQIDALYNSLRIEFERSTIEKASSSSYIIYKDLTLSIQDGINTFRDFIEKEKGFREQIMAAFDGKTKGVDLKLSTPIKDKLKERIRREYFNMTQLYFTRLHGLRV